MKTIDNFRGEYAFLSNFYECEITYGEIVYPTVEHAYQAMKSDSIHIREIISKWPGPAEAKRLGREIVIRSDWELVKDAIMFDLCSLKFNQGWFAEKLLLTGNAYIIEGNHWHDNTWGICRCNKCGYNGLNKLGLILMQIRDNLSRRSIG